MSGGLYTQSYYNIKCLVLFLSRAKPTRRGRLRCGGGDLFPCDVQFYNWARTATLEEFSQIIQAPSSTHPGRTYPVRENPISKAYQNSHTLVPLRGALYLSEGFALTGYVVPGCVEDGAWMIWENSSVVAVLARSLLDMFGRFWPNMFKTCLKRSGQ